MSYRGINYEFFNLKSSKRAKMNENISNILKNTRAVKRIAVKYIVCCQKYDEDPNRIYYLDYFG